MKLQGINITVTRPIDSIPIIGWVNHKLAGEPDYALTIILLGLSLFGFIMALFGPPVIKAAIIAYWIVP